MDKTVSKRSVEDLAKALKKARENGQQIVPIVGAGLSAESGFPVIAEVVRYFGKLYRYIQMRGPLYDYRNDEKLTQDIFDHHFRRYEKKPWGFFEDFDWPDRFQLNQDLFTKLKEDPRNDPVKDLIDWDVRERLDSLLPHLNPQGETEYSELHADLGKFLDEIDNKKSSDGESSKNPELQKAISHLRERIDSRFQTHWSKSARFNVIGDWRRLILYFTNYRSDYADALFARFGATRKPGQGHQFLAFLSKCLAVRTILTFNFDSLIEEALNTEGIRCKVFAMERGAGLPHENLVRDQLSVIKAHGSTHALLLDEQLDRPLSKEYLKRFDRIAGPNPVLLVLGCSANDRRLRDIVSHVIDKSRHYESSDATEALSVAWLHYEPSPPEFLDDKENEGPLRPGTVVALPTNNPGATLLHLYSWLTNSNPASRVPYLAHVQQPIELASAATSDKTSQAISSETSKDQFDWICVGKKSRSMTASQVLLKLANNWARQGYQFIWIDLEALHTFAGVVGSIIDQCRKYDPDLAPSLLPVDIDQVGDTRQDERFLDKVIKSAAKRVARALRRARYYLAIDGLDTYAWPATTHHGLTHMALSRGAKRRIESMAEFLKLLEKEDLGESRVGVGFDTLTTRYPGLKSPKPAWYKGLANKARRQARQRGDHGIPNPEFDFTDYFSQLDDLPIYSLRTIPRELQRLLSEQQSTGCSELQCRALMAMVLFSLSCFRRTRPLVATNYLLEPLFGNAFDRDRLQQILRLFTEQADATERIWILQQLEGGSYWFNHSIRDQLYAANTTYTSTESMGKCLDHQATIKPTETIRVHRRNAVFQLFLCAITHQRISQIWYNQTFVQSRDTFAFLEYTYHRVSSIRNLVKLRALARVGTRDQRVANDIVSGISKCSELIRLLNNEKPPFEELGFGNDGQFAGVLRDYSEDDDSSSRKWCEEAVEIQESLQRLHRRQLHGLCRAWTRTELNLRNQVPAEQLLHWCEELVGDDLEHRCNRLVISYRNRSGKSKTKEPNFEPVYYNFGSEAKPDDLVDPELEKGDIKKFRRFLQDLQVKLWIERSDYETCIRHRRRHLWDSMRSDVRSKLKREHSSLGQIPEKGPITSEIENCDDLIQGSRIRECHQLLHIVNCKLKLQQELTIDDKGLKEKTHEISSLLKKIKKRLQVLDPIKKRPNAKDPNTPDELSQVQANDFNEAWLRLLHLEAETHIGHVSMFSHDGFTGNPKHWEPLAVNMKAAQQTITQGLEEIGGRDIHTREAPKSVILHPTTDSALYLQYRSVFYLLKGRTEWLIETEAKANGKDRAESLKKALHSFEMARGGLDNETPLISGLIDIYLAEAFLGHARAALFDLNAKNGLQRAHEMYDSARGGLRRARESLLANPHHLMWRKLFFRITTQYHADRLFWRYAKLQNTAASQVEDPSKEPTANYWQENAREALLRLRRAYQTLVSALDLYLTPTAKTDSAHDAKTENVEQSNRFRWLYRMWWELTLCGYATGRLVMETQRGSIDSDELCDQADAYVIAQLKWLNKADSVDDSALGSVIENNYARLKTYYEESLTTGEGETPLTKALSRRRHLMDRANKLSEEKEWHKNFRQI